MISVVLATHNEEKNLQKCLESVKSFADEIIIVDGESTDGTITLAKKLGAKVHSTTNKANFHINKQMAMDKAKGDLVLQLDADEIVDEELALFIQQTHSQILKQVQDDGIVQDDETVKNDKHIDNITLPAAWWLKRKNWFLGSFLKKGGQYPDPVIRLYQKGKARLPQKDVHEQMVVDGEVGWANGHLLHYGNPTFEEYLRKWNTYTSFKATQLRDARVTISFYNSLRFMLFKPFSTWFSLFIRHKGFVDGYPGFVFAVYSGLHHCVAYLKLWEMYEVERLQNTNK